MFLMGNYQPCDCLFTLSMIAYEGLHLSNLAIFSSLFLLEGPFPVNSLDSASLPSATPT